MVSSSMTVQPPKSFMAKFVITWVSFFYSFNPGFHTGRVGGGSPGISYHFKRYIRI